MKLTDIPPHVTEMEPPPPFLWKAIQAKYNIDFDEAEVIPLYHLDYWDGPLSGMMECGGIQFYTKAIYYMERTWWACWELLPEEANALRINNKLFEEFVGDHNRYFKDEDGNWNRSVGKTRPKELWDKFYKDPEIPKVDYKQIEAREIFGIHYNPFRNY